MRPVSPTVSVMLACSHSRSPSVSISAQPGSPVDMGTKHNTSTIHDFQNLRGDPFDPNYSIPPQLFTFWLPLQTRNPEPEGPGTCSGEVL